MSSEKNFSRRNLNSSSYQTVQTVEYFFNQWKIMSIPPQDQFKLNQAAYNQFEERIKNAKSLQQLTSILQDMNNNPEQLFPNKTIIYRLIHKLSMFNKYALARDIFYFSLNKKLSHAYTYDIMINAAGKHKDFLLVQKIFQKSIDNKIRLNNSTYAILMNAAAENNDFPFAIQVLEDARKCNIFLNQYTYGSFFKAAYKNNDLSFIETIYGVYEEAKTKNKLDLFSLNPLLDHLVKNNLLEKAETIFNTHLSDFLFEEKINYSFLDLHELSTGSVYLKLKYYIEKYFDTHQQDDLSIQVVHGKGNNTKHPMPGVDIPVKQGLNKFIEDFQEYYNIKPIKQYDGAVYYTFSRPKQPVLQTQYPAVKSQGVESFPFLEKSPSVKNSQPEPISYYAYAKNIVQQAIPAHYSIDINSKFKAKKILEEILEKEKIVLPLPSDVEKSIQLLLRNSIYHPWTYRGFFCCERCIRLENNLQKNAFTEENVKLLVKESLVNQPNVTLYSL